MLRPHGVWLMNTYGTGNNLQLVRGLSTYWLSTLWWILRRLMDSWKTSVLFSDGAKSRPYLYNNNKKKRKEKKNGQQWTTANNELMQRATVPRDDSQSRPWNANNKPLGLPRVKDFKNSTYLRLVQTDLVEYSFLNPDQNWLLKGLFLRFCFPPNVLLHNIFYATADITS